MSEANGAGAGAGARAGRGPTHRFSAADEAAVVMALAEGATVKAAAQGVGFAVQTLYDARGRSAVFAAAWDEAVAESARPRLVEPGPGRRWQVKKLRRVRFNEERKNAFLAHFAATCDVTASAAAAGVCVSTVYDHRSRDSAFHARWDEALEAGYARLEAEALAMRLAAIERLKVQLGKKVRPRDCDEGAEFERVMHLLREHKRGLAGYQKNGRPPAKRMSFDEAMEELEKALDKFEPDAPHDETPSYPDDDLPA
ncbi:MAG: hypothetical protein ACT4N8_10600 [Sphingosinicella sp.]|uniref:hypothetical protein n=1 Tax=Sphingosinicella sp. TaxID=1917971 RepID=UPI0040378BBF